jgi:hypothetical protein
MHPLTQYININTNQKLMCTIQFLPNTLGFPDRLRVCYEEKLKSNSEKSSVFQITLNRNVRVKCLPTYTQQ